MITETVNQRIASRVRYVKPVRLSSATGATAELYQQLKTDFMPAPLLLLHSSAPELLAGVWSILRETLLAGEKADRAVKEIVAAAVAAAFAGFANVVERAGREILSEQVRSLVTQYVLAWNGESMGEDYGWVDDAIAGVEVEHRAAARLALMVALSLEVKPQAVTDFQLQFPEDAQLIAATAWASFTAARRAGSWLVAGVAEIRRKQ